MKKFMLLSLLLVLVSCGKGGDDDGAVTTRSNVKTDDYIGGFCSQFVVEDYNKSVGRPCNNVATLEGLKTCQSNTRAFKNAYAGIDCIAEDLSTGESMTIDEAYLNDIIREVSVVIDQLESNS